MTIAITSEETPPATVAQLRTEKAEYKKPRNGRGNVAAHVERMQQEHLALSRRIDELQQSPGVDHVTITALKRRKLLLKEGIHRHDAETLTATP